VALTRIVYSKTEKYSKNCINLPRNCLFFSVAHQTYSKKKIGKTMDQISAGLVYLKNKFPKISCDKIKEAIFVGLQV